MSTELATVGPREVAITQEQTALIKQTICQGATDAEMKLFFYDCQRRGVHPLDKLIHFTKRKGKYVPITSIDFFRIRAQASEAFAGEEEAEFVIGEDGFPDSCKYVVYRLVNGQRYSWTATARWSEYYPGEEQGFNWKKMPFLMLAKCAEALALRKAFPGELQGLYVKEEMDQAEERKPAYMDHKREASAKLAEIKGDAVGSSTAGKEETGAQDGLNVATECSPVVASPGFQQNQDAAPSSSDDPADPWRAKLRTCEQTVKELNRVFGSIPETIRQDCFQEYNERLRKVKGK